MIHRLPFFKCCLPSTSCVLFSASLGREHLKTMQLKIFSVDISLPNGNGEEESSNESEDEESEGNSPSASESDSSVSEESSEGQEVSS